jgi:hypothetical protein
MYCITLLVEEEEYACVEDTSRGRNSCPMSGGGDFFLLLLLTDIETKGRMDGGLCCVYQKQPI